jgi:ribA/ribD-fused uncharacterized protein
MEMPKMLCVRLEGENIMKTLEELKKAINEGQTFVYELFWGGPFSQWAKSPFFVSGKKYPTAEHWMMAQKATMFNDSDALERIMKTTNPRNAKKIGRQVKGFDVDVWESRCFEYVTTGSIYKFQQNEDLKKVLMATGDKVLVEASPYDKIWGIGMGEDDLRCNDPFKWDGTNYLGFALMEAREFLKKELDN